MTPVAKPGQSFESLSRRLRPVLEQRLAGSVPSDDSRLSEAMREALLSPGKRIRALVAIASGFVFRGEEEPLVDFGVAIEAIHAASLVFDDLPCMDDGSVRRGRPSLHRRFGEATAVLAAISLINRAFEILASASGLAPRTKARLVSELSRASGERGSCRGQDADLSSDPRLAGLEELERIHALKTGELFVAAARGGAIAARASEGEIEAMTRYAKNLGLAFQIIDDLLEVEGDEARTGKKAHGEGHRANFAKILGPEIARTIARELTEAAASAVGALGRRAAPLSDLAYALRDRRS